MCFRGFAQCQQNFKFWLCLFVVWQTSEKCTRACARRAARLFSPCSQWNDRFGELSSALPSSIRHGFLNYIETRSLLASLNGILHWALLILQPAKISLLPLSCRFTVASFWPIFRWFYKSPFLSALHLQSFNINRQKSTFIRAVHH